MRILILGGTAWLGSTIATTAVTAGHDVTCVARGTGVPGGASAVQADRDHDAALASVAAERWDAVVDVARQPGHVRRAVRDLAGSAGRYVFVSTANVYASQAAIGGDEDAARLAPLDSDAYTDPEDYGPAKVACEDAVLAGFGADRTTIVRAGLIGGPGDPSGRSTYWPRRFAHPSGNAVLAVDAPDLPTAFIDVRDLAAFIVRAAEGHASGTFDAFGVAVPFPAHLRAARDAAGSDAEIVSAPGEWLTARGVNQWSGERSLPLWLADPDWYGMNARSSARAVAAGLERRPLAESLRDVLAAESAAPFPGGAGLTDAQERELLDALER